MNDVKTLIKEIASIDIKGKLLIIASDDIDEQYAAHVSEELRKLGGVGLLVMPADSSLSALTFTEAKEVLEQIKDKE